MEFRLLMAALQLAYQKGVERGARQGSQPNAAVVAQDMGEIMAAISRMDLRQAYRDAHDFQ